MENEPSEKLLPNKPLSKEDLELIFECGFIQRGIDIEKNCTQSDFWFINPISDKITPGDENDILQIKAYNNIASKNKKGFNIKSYNKELVNLIKILENDIHMLNMQKAEYENQINNLEKIDYVFFL